MKNARFWIFVNNSYAKITLEPGQVLTHEQGSSNEEGWSYELVKFTYPSDEEVVYQEWEQESQDCDGRHQIDGESCCPIIQLAVNEPYGDKGFLLPDWGKSRDSVVYDQYAEMAGY